VKGSSRWMSGGRLVRGRLRLRFRVRLRRPRAALSCPGVDRWCDNEAESSKVLYPPFSSSQFLQKKWLQAASVLQGPADKSHYVVVRCADLGRYLCASRKSWAQTTRETREQKIMSESPRQSLESKNNACNEAVASFGRTRTERVPRRASVGRREAGDGKQSSSVWCCGIPTAVE
jgi:hypothetical protein